MKTLQPLCRFDDGLQGPCRRKAAVLATDSCKTDPMGYTPVCKTHLRNAITAGLRRATVRPAGHRVPVSILPLDNQCAEDLYR